MNPHSVWQIWSDSREKGHFLWILMNLLLNLSHRSNSLPVRCRFLRYRWPVRSGLAPRKPHRTGKLLMKCAVINSSISGNNFKAWQSESKMIWMHLTPTRGVNTGWGLKNWFRFDIVSFTDSSSVDQFSICTAYVNLKSGPNASKSFWIHFAQNFRPRLYLIWFSQMIMNALKIFNFLFLKFV